MSGRGIKIFLIAAALLASLFIGGCPKLDSVPALVIKSDPLSPDEHARLGAIYEREGNSGRAQDEYAAAVKKDPQNLVALTGLGNVSCQVGRYRVAVSYYQRALAVDETNPVVHNNLALALIQTGKVQDALAHAERAVTLTASRDPRYLDTRAQARLAANDPDRARADLEQALALCSNPDPSLASACQEIQERFDKLQTSNPKP
jgi:tetratricopeptide (TPR) repeat protein